MDNTLYISDLDGTLLQPDGTISKYTREKIHEIIDAGIHFTIATARSITSTKEILGDLPLKLPVICSNGGTIFNFHTKENLHVEYMTSNIVKEIIDAIKDEPHSAFMSGLIDGEEKIFFDELTNDGMHWFHQNRIEANDKRLTKIDDLRAYSLHPITSITLMNRAQNLLQKKKFYSKQYAKTLKVNYFENKYSVGWYWLSLHSANSTKGNAIERLKNMLNLNHLNTTVFGDEMNDLPMFAIADHAVAVGNALPEVKRASHSVIGANHENAVVDFILGQ